MRWSDTCGKAGKSLNVAGFQWTSVTVRAAKLTATSALSVCSGGGAAVTVTVSEALPGVRTALNRATVETEIVMFAWVKDLNPVALTSTLYSPGARYGML